MHNDLINTKNRYLVKKLLIITILMFGFGFAMVPFYSVFCRVTGLNGKTSGKIEITKSLGLVDNNRLLTVEFTSNLYQGADWEFLPRTEKIAVHPGSFYQVHFWAKNLTNKILIGQAIPSVSPGIAASYFQKIECFCFNNQLFQAGEGKDMPVTFRIDPSIPDDVHTVTLSYTFFKVREG